MNWLDIFLIVALFIPAFIGLKQGIIKSALSPAGLIVGVVLASNFYTVLGSALSLIPNEQVAEFVAFGLIIAVVMLITSLASRLLKSILSIVMLGWVDHLGGVVFGVLLGSILWGATLAVWVGFFGTGLVTESFIAAVLLDKFPLVLALLPSEFDIIRNYFQ